MTCTCRKDIEHKLRARFKDESPDAKNHSAKLTGYVVIIADAGLVSKGCMGIDLAADHPLKNGGFKAKTTRNKMIFTYCPFCGEKY